MRILDLTVGSSVDIHRTTHVGYIKTDYKFLLDMLGKPTDLSRDDKSTVSWSVEFLVGTRRLEKNDNDPEKIVATIYDWKTVSTPKERYEWHIGGHSPRAERCVKHYLGFLTGDICI